MFTLHGVWNKLTCKSKCFLACLRTRTYPDILKPCTSMSSYSVSFEHSNCFFLIDVGCEVILKSLKQT